MTTEPNMAVVLNNQQGDYFLVPVEALKQWQIPEEQKDDIERLVAEQDDVRGHLLDLLHLTPLAVIATGVYLVGRETGAWDALGKSIDWQSHLP